MSEVRSAAAQAGICDAQKLIYDVSSAFSKAQNIDDLDEEWQRYITPVYAQIDSGDMHIISRLYALTATVLLQRMGGL